ncbi:hypothetical protein [Pseudomonas sp. CCC2.2]|uniref:hypothetical protein n=1 Tax=Pseudomonas sp. CCC2.2 TaxID=3048605 RepID=UPI002B2302D2|nr:hypothetical protein [Pseudomonas sp. CCC2.2]MEB0149046.1 hypothetical protein [Pseudomonas sp. CCC2.2]
MKPFVKVMALGCLFQIAAIAMFNLVLFSHIQDDNRKWSLLAEKEAIEASNATSLNYYNRTVLDRAQDKIDMQLWVNKIVALRFEQDHMNKQSTGDK